MPERRRESFGSLSGSTVIRGEVGGLEVAEEAIDLRLSLRGASSGEGRAPRNGLVSLIGELGPRVLLTKPVMERSDWCLSSTEGSTGRESGAGGSGVGSDAGEDDE